MTDNKPNPARAAELYGQALQAFQAQHRGRVVQLADVPDSYVLGPVDLVLPAPAASSASTARHASGH